MCISFHTDEDGAQETKRRVEAAGRRARFMQFDVADASSVQAVFDRTAADLGTPDLLVANVGTGMGGIPAANMDLDGAKMMEVLQTDLVGLPFCARAFVQQRKAAGGAGRLSFIGSVAGHLPMPGNTPYGMVKAGVKSLVRSPAEGGGGGPEQHERHRSRPDRNAYDSEALGRS